MPIGESFSKEYFCLFLLGGITYHIKIKQPIHMRSSCLRRHSIIGAS